MARTSITLPEVGFLADCNRQQRERIASLSVTLEVSAGRRLCRADSSDRQFLVIVEGEATVTVDGADVATFGPGCGFGAVAVITPEGRRGAAVTAAMPMTLLVLHPGEFDTLAKAVPLIARRVQDETASRLSQATARQHAAGTAPPRSFEANTQRRRTREGITTVMEGIGCVGPTGAPGGSETQGRTR
jgi:CRP-like cAMP-binding protein